ncbi:hypothetical protein FA15DRAFT_668372 [Coprinopsis marcescibilis]|uniref:Uncharacterized protein n=1 Tax=Coprinopsis marcescibilis TaxID=230819 RepID=A0A5C3LB41_COPMA|nr:hypothetical protein FA15DRAFT_668372 [Coprinopsis marcescibilis]
MNTDPSSLTTINRLLRPLRTRSSVLAKVATTNNHSTNPSATYSSSNRSVLRIVPQSSPLNILPPPHKVASQLYFSKEEKGTLDLARRIYAVRDAFKNIVVKADLPVDAGSRVMPLSALCASIIGQHMQEWEEPEDADNEHQSSFEVVPTYSEEMYDAVPGSYRSHLLVSHALGIILDVCPHHTTLLSILLDVALVHNLGTQASQLLEAFLFVALRPKPNAPASICHASHAKFLVDHLDKWISAGFPVESFIKILSTVLGETEDIATWSSKAIGMLGSRLQHVHMPSLRWLSTRLVIFLSTEQPPGSSPGSRDQLFLTASRWIDGVTNIMIYTVTTNQSHRLPNHDWLLDLVAALQQTLTCAGERTCGVQCLQDSFTCLCTHLLALHPDILSSISNGVARCLSLNRPRASTFHSLVNAVFGSKQTLDLQHSHKALKTYVSAFQTHHLIQQEASLWTCALTFVENLETDSELQGKRTEIKLYREQLMLLVDTAERSLPSQSFDNLLDTGPEPTPRPSKLISHDLTTPARRNNDEWDWDAMMSCWIRRRRPQEVLAKDWPPKPSLWSIKKCKIASVTPRKGAAVPFSPHKAIPFHPLGRKFHKQSDSGQDQRPLNDFTSLVANAVSHRTTLHGPHKLKAFKTQSSSAIKPLVHSVDLGAREKGNLPLTAEVESCHLPSDDVLDLFATP